MTKKELEKRVAELEEEVRFLRGLLETRYGHAAPFIGGWWQQPWLHTWADTKTVDVPTTSYNDCPCMPHNGGSGVCNCVRPELSPTYTGITSPSEATC